MASADDYAKWIVDNQAKQGTPEFDTVSKAYQEAKGQRQQSPQGESWAKKLAPGYMGPLGGVRMWQEGIHPNQLLDKAAYQTGSGVTGLASDAGASPEIAAGLGTAANLGVGAIPGVAGGFLGRALPVLQNAGRTLMKHAIGPTLGDTLKGKAEPAVSTFFERGLNPTESGLNTLSKRVSELKGTESGITGASNKVISLDEPVSNLSALESKVGGATTGVEDASDVRKITAKLLEHPNVDEAGLMSVANAQRMKELNYKKMGDAAYGAGLKPAAERDALKAATAGLRSSIEGAEPAVIPINKEISELMNAIKVAQRHVAGESNRSLLPMGASFATASHNPVAAVGMYGVSNSYIQSMLARLLHHTGSERVQKETAAALGTALGAYSGRTPQENR